MSNQIGKFDVSEPTSLVDLIEIERSSKGGVAKFIELLLERGEEQQACDWYREISIHMQMLREYLNAYFSQRIEFLDAYRKFRRQIIFAQKNLLDAENLVFTITDEADLRELKHELKQDRKETEGVFLSADDRERLIPFIDQQLQAINQPMVLPDFRERLLSKFILVLHPAKPQWHLCVDAESIIHAQIFENCADRMGDIAVSFKGNFMKDCGVEALVEGATVTCVNRALITHFADDIRTYVEECLKNQLGLDEAKVKIGY